VPQIYVQQYVTWHDLATVRIRRTQFFAAAIYPDVEACTADEKNTQVPDEHDPLLFLTASGSLQMIVSLNLSKEAKQEVSSYEDK
jgi:hypothetical protein